MSDVSQGPGWWQASDGKWYPPEKHPNAQPTAAPPTSPPTGPPPGAPGGQPMGAAPAFGAPGGGSGVTIGDAFSWGWLKFQQNVGPMILAALAVIVGIVVVEIILMLILFGGIGLSASSDSGALSGGGFAVSLIGSALISVVAYIGMMFIQMAIIRGTLMITDGQKPTVAEMFKTDQLGSYIIATLLVAVAQFIGSMLCYLPGLAVMFFTFFYGWFVIDKKMAPVDAIKASISLVNQNIGVLVGFIIVAMVAMFIGAMVCGIGLLVAGPVVVLSTGYVYKRLQGEPVPA